MAGSEKSNATGGNCELRELIGKVLVNQSLFNSQMIILVNKLAEGEKVQLTELKTLSELYQASAGGVQDVISLSKNGKTTASS